MYQKKLLKKSVKHTLSWVSVPKETTYTVFYSGRCNIRQVVFQTQYIWGGFNLPIRKLGTWATTIKDFSNKNQFWTPSRFFTHHQNQRFLEKFAQNHRGDWWPWWTRLCSHTDWATIRRHCRLPGVKKRSAYSYCFHMFFLPFHGSPSCRFIFVIISSNNVQ